MSELIIYWGRRSEDTFRWRVRNDESIRAQDSETLSDQLLKADLPALAAIAINHRVHLVLAGQDVHSETVDMPGKARRHLRKALPYMLEDNLATPVDEVFFAFNPIDADKILVHAVERNYLQELIHIFNKAEMQLHAISVLHDWVQVPEQGIGVLALKDQISIASPTQRVTLARPVASVAFKQMVSDIQDHELPVVVPVVMYSDQQEENFGGDLPVNQVAIDTRRVTDVMDFLLQSPAKPMNFMQGEFAIKKEASPLKQYFTTAAKIAAILLAGFVLLRISEVINLEQKKQHLEQQKVALYQQLFRGKNLRGDAYKAMRSALKAQGNTGQGRTFLPLFLQVSELMPSDMGITLTNIAFDAGKSELKIDLHADSLQKLNDYRDALVAAGLDVEMSSATQSGEGYNSRLTIRRLS